MSSVQYLNPDTLYRNPTYSNTVVVTGNARTIYVGGQSAFDAEGVVIGLGDLGAQAEQVMKNVEAALASGGAGLEHVVKWTVYIVQGQPLAPAFSAFLKAWGGRGDMPTVSVVYVAGLAFPEFLVMLDAVAVVPG